MKRPLNKIIRTLRARRFKAVVKGHGFKAYSFKRQAEVLTALIREVSAK